MRCNLIYKLHRRKIERRKHRTDSCSSFNSLKNIFLPVSLSVVNSFLEECILFFLYLRYTVMPDAAMVFAVNLYWRSHVIYYYAWCVVSMKTVLLERIAAIIIKCAFKLQFVLNRKIMSTSNAHRAFGIDWIDLLCVPQLSWISFDVRENKSRAFDGSDREKFSFVQDINQLIG